jgi:hypothetical protein
MDLTECMQDSVKDGKRAPAEPRCVPECERPPEIGDDTCDNTGDPGDIVGVHAGGDPDASRPSSPGLNSGPASSLPSSQEEADDASDWLDFSRLFEASVDDDDCGVDCGPDDTVAPTSINFAVRSLIWI